MDWYDGDDEDEPDDIAYSDADPQPVCDGCGAPVSVPGELCATCYFHENGSNHWPR